MGLSYDTWRTTPPDDLPGRRARFCPDTVENPLFIEAGELTIDATGHYSGETGDLLSVEVNSLHHTPEAVAAMLAAFCPEGIDRWAEPLDTTRLYELVNDHAISAEDW
jgi:hypothetical protein